MDEYYNEKASGFIGEDRVGMVCDLFKEKAERWERGVCSYTFSSLCKFPIYETDFGWGKPAWVTVPGALSDVYGPDGYEIRRWG